MPRTGFAFFAPATMPISDVVEIAQAAEAQGYESFWLTEGGGMDAVTRLAVVAGQTRRIKLGTSVITIFSRTAPAIAQTAASLHEITGGRFILGLGAGHKLAVERGLGMPYSKPAARMEDYVRIIKAALKDGKVSHQGAAVSAEFQLPVGPRQVPVYIATLGGPMARVAGAVADGVLPLMAGPVGVQQLREEIATAAAGAGRDPAAVDVGCMIIACASDNSSAAEETARRRVAGFIPMPFYQRIMRMSGFEAEVDRMVQALEAGDGDQVSRLVSDRMLESLTLLGGAAGWRKTLDRFRAAGVTLPIVHCAPVGPDAKASVLQALRTLSPADLAEKAPSSSRSRN